MFVVITELVCIFCHFILHILEHFTKFTGYLYDVI